MFLVDRANKPRLKTTPGASHGLFQPVVSEKNVCLLINKKQGRNQLSSLKKPALAENGGTNEVHKVAFIEVFACERFSSSCPFSTD